MDADNFDRRSQPRPGVRPILDAMSIGQAHRTLREVVADEMRGMIVRGELLPGERLYEDRLAEQLGVSRNPVREAIRALEGTGLVEVLPRRGAYVSRLDPRQIEQLLDMRSVIEAYAAELAAEHRTDEHLAAMRQCVAEGEAAAKQGDFVAAAAVHREFLMAIERASGNEYFSVVAGPLRHKTELVFSMLADKRGSVGWKEHRQVVDAIAARDPQAARRLTFEHMSSVKRDLHMVSPQAVDAAIPAT